MEKLHLMTSQLARQRILVDPPSQLAEERQMRLVSLTAARRIPIALHRDHGRENNGFQRHLFRRARCARFGRRNRQPQNLKTTYSKTAPTCSRRRNDPSQGASIAAFPVVVENAASTIRWCLPGRYQTDFHRAPRTRQPESINFCREGRRE